VNLVNVFRLVCESKGYEFHSAGSAVEGLAAIEAVEPDLVILDVIMEDFVAGFRVVNELRANPASRLSRFSLVPIIMLTSVTSKTQVDFAERVGTALLPVDAFVEKPVKPAEMLATIEAVLERASARRGRAPGSAPDR
jgi:two-component system sensor histidine kinase/response regulator